MISRMQPWHEIATFFLSLCVVLILLLLVVVPAHSQNQMTPSQRAVELVDDSVSPTSPGVLACLTLQILFLAGIMISYLRISYRVESRKSFPHHHWWQGRLHWHH
jgi:predicted MFS family arabinose efflux permease